MGILPRIDRFRFILHVGIVFFCAAACSQPVRGEGKHDFDRWEKDIAEFERQDALKPPPQNAVLFAGSSSIRLWKLSKSFPDLKTINRGFGGSQIVDSIHFADRIILKHKPRIVVLYAGDNDINAGKSPERVATDFREFVKTIHAGLPETKIVFIAIKPSIKRWELSGNMKRANSLIERRCGKHQNLVYADIFSPMLGKDGKPKAELFVEDGLHLNERGYTLWSGIIRPHLK